MKTRLIALVTLLVSSTGLLAQCLDPYYPKVYPSRVESGVIYGTSTQYDGTPVVLKMNIWKPVGDNNTARPVLMWIHGGGFYSGVKEDLDSLASYYAQRGYVSATIAYRLGFYGPGFYSAPFTYDSSEVIRAAFRAIQDANGALRFLKGRASADSTNTQLAFVGGASAGAITALNLAYINNPSEQPGDVDSISNVVTLFSNAVRPPLGPYTGALNLNGENTDVKAVVNFYGAVLDTTVIDQNTDPALFSYHQTGDPVVACGYNVGLWNMPLNVSANYPHLYGSCAIENRMLSLGYSPQHYQSYFYNGTTHGIHDEVLVDTLVARFLSDIICETVSGVNEPGTSFQPAVVYPNPAGDQVYLKTGKHFGKTEVRVCNLNGAVVYKSEIVAPSTLAIPLNGLSEGIYFLQIISEAGAESLKLVHY
ncbi:MAG TPA: T9SS type A sorting domain-containing protein [Bacteroidia bacterium]|nr:T9SS type A sorting domain-containing protein [Bacteroidia bacterium]